ncbi:class I SAM-dependent methyltransferase [Amycolatopsis sp. NPDC059021]|uniref:class I SAM-dependent methyltransferase n=1 Tax=Amycolatopsis sp. NPDC059021 TaxID=3346704 RepID=UPI00366FE326
MTASPDSLPAVSRTALGVAGLRALESTRPDKLFDDPYARAFFEAGRDLFPEAPDSAEELTSSNPANRLGAVFYAHVVVRTRFYDEYLLAATAAGCRQVVLLAAGLDTRAYRLGWPGGLRLFELDLPDVLAFKDDVLTRESATPRCARTVVPADLREDWPGELRAAGFDPALPTAWLAEGLLVYLSYDEATRMLATVGDLSAPGSRLACEHRPDGDQDGLLTQARALRGAENVTSLWKGGLGTHATDWLSDHGWQPQTYSRSSLAVAYGREADGTAGGFLIAVRD